MNKNLFVKQSTLKKNISIYGVGLHSGKKVKLKLKPNKEDTGIIFRRTDISTSIIIPALITNVISTKFSTVIGKNNISIKTIEHLLSAISILKIDNILIELDADEVPVVDGSAYPFVYSLLSCGIRYLNKPKKFLKIKKEMNFKFLSRFILLLPSHDLHFFFYLIEINKLTKELNLDYTPNKCILLTSKARTFGYYSNYLRLLVYNFSKGAKINNVLIFHGNNLFNKNIFRYNNERIKHKLLDFVGDLSLVGKSIMCSFFLTMPGHLLNNFILHYLLSNPSFYDIVLFHKNNGFIKF